MLATAMLFSRAAVCIERTVRGEIEEIGLDAAEIAGVARVAVQREEEIAARGVRERRALLERQVDVPVAGENRLVARRLQQVAHAQREIERHVLFLEAADADRPGVVRAVAGVDDHAAHAQPELSRQRRLAGGCGLAGRACDAGGRACAACGRRRWFRSGRGGGARGAAAGATPEKVAGGAGAGGAAGGDDAGETGVCGVSAA